MKLDILKSSIVIKLIKAIIVIIANKIKIMELVIIKQIKFEFMVIKPLNVKLKAIEPFVIKFRVINSIILALWDINQMIISIKLIDFKVKHKRFKEF